jgi:hypothetical protein
MSDNNDARGHRNDAGPFDEVTVDASKSIICYSKCIEVFHFIRSRTNYVIDGQHSKIILLFS